MFTKFIRHMVCGLALGLGLAISACQPIQAPTQPAVAANATELPGVKRSPGGPTVAFVHEQVLSIHRGDHAVTVEDCTNGCHVYYLTWSPDGQRLAYFYSPATAQEHFAIRLTDLRGQVQTVATNVGWIAPPAWSPHGEQLAYLVATDRYVVEVWTTEVMENGTTADAHKRGEVSIGGDCGGGGRSESAALYETEGGLAYGGYLAGVLAWTADDLLIYSNHCSARGVGRFDLATGTALAPYPGKLGSLALNRARDSWVAVDEQQHLVTGRPADLTYAPIETKAVPELAFYGQVTDDIFYTTLVVTGTADLYVGASEQKQSIPVSPYFEFTQPGLRVANQAGRETLLWEGDGYAYARIQQSADGALYFVRIGDSKSLYTALNAGTLTAATVNELRPTVDVLRLLPASAKPEVWLENATQFTLAPTALP